MTPHPEGGWAPPVRVDPERKANAELLREGPDRLRGLAEPYPHDLQSLRLEPLGGPEVLRRSAPG
jgi:hypothetical protein